jgi:hypothetical protein
MSGTTPRPANAHVQAPAVISSSADVEKKTSSTGNIKEMESSLPRPVRAGGPTNDGSKYNFAEL